MKNQRMAKSKEMKQELEKLLIKGDELIAHPLDTFISLSARYMLQVALEKEVEEFLGRTHYQRGNRLRQGYRNGYEPKKLKNTNGILEVFTPQLRNTSEKFHSSLIERLKSGSDALNKMAMEMYVRGLSTGDIELLFENTFGKRILSKSAVSEISETLSINFNIWRSRSLKELNIVYLFLDGIYFALRQGTSEKEGILCAYGITLEGKKVLIHLDLGERESYDAWLCFLQDMVQRDLKEPLLVIYDGNPGLKKAIREVFPSSLKQRCQVHKMRNILSKLPRKATAELKPLILQVFRAKSYNEGLQKGKELIARFKELYPSAMESLEKDLEECLTYLKFPVLHHKSIRSTNLLERTFEEGRRRTKVIPRFPNEESCFKLVFSALISSSRSWRGLPMTPDIVIQLEKIRKEIFALKTSSFFSSSREITVGQRTAFGQDTNLTNEKEYATINHIDKNDFTRCP